MIIKLKSDITNNEFNYIKTYFESQKLSLKDISSDNVKLYGIIGDTTLLDIDTISSIPGIIGASRVSVPYKLTSREFHPEDTLLSFDDYMIGGANFTVIAGSNLITNKDSFRKLSLSIRDSGAHFLYGGAYKIDMNPYGFQGLKDEAIKILEDNKEMYNIPVVSEITSIEDYSKFSNIDIIKIGEQNMNNYPLLSFLGSKDNPLILTRGKSSTINELLLSAEVIMKEGNTKIILCDEGIRTFEYNKLSLDLSSALTIKKLSHLPVFVSLQALKNDEDIINIAKAYLSIGINGILVNVDDNESSLNKDEFDLMMKKLRLIAPIVDKEIV